MMIVSFQSMIQSHSISNKHRKSRVKHELAKIQSTMCLDNKSSLMAIKTLVATYLLAHLTFDCVLLRCNTQKISPSSHLQAHQQHLLNVAIQNSRQANNPRQPTYQQNNPTNLTLSSRPLDRPSLSLVPGNDQQPGSPRTNISVSGEPEPVEDWLMMGGGGGGGGAGDLMPDEGKNVASFVDSTSGSNRNSTLKRSGHKRQNQNSKSSNKTSMFDNEQLDSSDTNEIFDDIEEGSTLAGTQKEPDCATHGRYYCTYKEEYPLKLVTEVTKYYKWPLEKLFRDLHAQIMPKLAQDSTGNLVCDSITRVVRPGWARNTNERWLVVINTENYHQYVTEVVCQYGSNSRCNFIPPCYYSSCQQRYNTQKLLVIDPANPYRGPFLSEFLFPSCCVCYVPSSSDSFQDKYRSSPATIYQRTVQQESSNNLYPPQFRPAGLMESDAAASIVADQSLAPPRTSSSTSSNPSSKQASGGNQAAAPGEIRRGGDQYKRLEQALQSSGEGPRHETNDVGTFPRIGIADALVHQQPSGSSQANEHTQ